MGSYFGSDFMHLSFYFFYFIFSFFQRELSDKTCRFEGKMVGGKKITETNK
jgi:hypothetical protein